MKKEKLVIIIRGGVLQSVLSSSLEYPIEIEVLDYDNYVDRVSYAGKELKALEKEIKDYYPIY